MKLFLVIAGIVVFTCFSIFSYVATLKNKVKKYQSFVEKVSASFHKLVDELSKEERIGMSLRSDLSPYEREGYDTRQVEYISKTVARATNFIHSLEKCIKEKDELYLALQEMSNSSISRITSLYADFRLLQYDLSEKYLSFKERPAKVEAWRIKELKQETKKYLEQFKQMQYKYEELLILFPELKDYVDNFETIKELENVKNLNQLREEYDNVRDYISKEDYQKLTELERNQLALERYIKREKTSWQIGRDYELFIGFLLRKEGCHVQQYGIEKRLEDLGCDIIATKDGKCYVIQCKRWKEERKIHEKNILHLYGTCMLFKINYKQKDAGGLFPREVVPLFVSTHEVTSTAREIANILGVKLSSIPFAEFPRIKCNINNGEKIYHLPFDQQYDRTKIEKEGEFYAYTVAEAASKGFRRAFRHRIDH
jgi:hypothetical protein